MFYKCLCLHPDTAWISNWAARYPRAPQLAALNRLPRRFAALQDRAWFDESGDAYVYGQPRSRLRRAVPAPVEGEPVYTRAGVSTGDEATAPDAGPALRRAVAALTRWGGGRTFISKRIANNRRVASLLGSFPKARFLHVVRDGRAVARSLANVDWWETSVVTWYGGTPADWRAAGRDPVELCARTWVEELNAVGTGLHRVPEAQRMVVRYEDALADPAAAMAGIARFADLPVDDDWLSRAVERLSARTGRREKVADTDALRIEAVQREQLQAFGYALVGA